VNDKDLFESSVIVQHIVVKLIGTTTDSNDHVVRFQGARKLVGSYQVEVVILMVLDNRHGDVIVFDNLFDLLVKSIVFSCFKLDWCGLEELITLGFNLLVCKSSFL
jgi:hypothetical protein